MRYRFEPIDLHVCVTACWQVYCQQCSFPHTHTTSSRRCKSGTFHDLHRTSKWSSWEADGKRLPWYLYPQRQINAAIDSESAQVPEGQTHLLLSNHRWLSFWATDNVHHSETPKSASGIHFSCAKAVCNAMDEEVRSRRPTLMIMSYVWCYGQIKFIYHEIFHKNWRCREW